MNQRTNGRALTILSGMVACLFTATAFDTAGASEGPTLASIEPLAREVQESVSFESLPATGKFAHRAFRNSDFVRRAGKTVLNWQPAEQGQVWLHVPAVPEDWSGYDELVLHLESARATGAKINLQLRSTGDRDEGYYLTQFEVDWRGPRTLRLSLDDDFTGHRAPAGMARIESMMFGASGWRAEPIAGTQLRVLDMQLVKIAHPVESLLAREGRQIWDAPNFNRRNYSGAVFHVNHREGDATVVDLSYQADSPLADEQPANLELRVFNPEDRCVLTADLSREGPQWYSTQIDLSDQPAGRYRISITGYHRGLALAAEPAQPIGVTGAYTLGLPGHVSDQYIYLPRDASFWELWVAARAPGQAIEVYDVDDRLVKTVEVPVEPTGWKRVRFDDVEGDSVWRLHATGGREFRVAVLGVPSVMWPDRASAEAYGRSVRHIAGRRVTHGWQVPMATWLAEVSEADLALNVDEPSRPDFSQMSDDQMLKLVPMVGAYGPLSQGPDLMEHQLLDIDAPQLGVFAYDLADIPDEPINPDWASPFRDTRYLNTLAWLYAYEADGINPYYRNPGLLNRIMAGVFQLWLAVGERQAVFSERADRPVLDTHMFFFLEPIASIYKLIGDDMPEPLQQAYRDGLVELFGRYAYHTAFMSNQWGHLLLGLYDAAEATGDPLLAAAYERNLTMLINHTAGSTNLGQSPAGYYYEFGGLDGIYNIMNEHAWSLLYRNSGDERLRDSVARSFELRRHLTVTGADGDLVSARNWNHRTNSGLAGGYPAARLLADWPVASRFVHRDPQQGEGHTNISWTVWHPDAARATLEHWWMRSVGFDRLGDRQGLAGPLGANLSYHAPPIAQPGQLACEEPGPFVRHFADEFTAGRFGPWYAVLYRGGAHSDRAFGGSGLATLWHERFGPIMLGHTPINGDHTPSTDEPDGVILTLTDAWTTPTDERRSTYKAHGKLTGDVDRAELASTLTTGGDDVFERSYTFQGQRMTSRGSHTSGAGANHTLYLPIVVGPNVEVVASSETHGNVELTVGQSAAIQQITWRLDGHVLRMTFEQPVPMTVVREEQLATTPLRIIRLDFNDQPGRWTVE
ncbi:hypothetical protein ACERK3_17420 [Phycisphaerales bacterium AB-hyl4]|uniref:Heparinase II/III-like protein n=1 Tax=Natronomicrosphaera hydrolytica TaxID=3242702 RepID=A0ABV4U8Y3_9BACT